MRTEIFIVSHAKDLPFLRYCIASIEKYASGFSGVTLLVPRHQEEHFAWAGSMASIRTFDEPPGKGMLSHEANICRADQWCPNADLILHLDSDCMFWRHATPEAWLMDGKPVLYRELYSDCHKSTNTRLLWQTAVENAIRLKPEWETMVRHPAIHWRDTYASTRHAVEAVHGDFDAYMLSGRNEFPQEVAEFPMLGAIAIRDFPERYHFVDYDHDRDASECHAKRKFQYIYRYERDFIVEVWSHGGMARSQRMFDEILAGNPPPFYIKGE